jgi:hypothetical protein
MAVLQQQAQHFACLLAWLHLGQLLVLLLLLLV